MNSKEYVTYKGEKIIVYEFLRISPISSTNKNVPFKREPVHNISEIKGLEKLAKLKKLYLSNNKISEIYIEVISL